MSLPTGTVTFLRTDIEGSMRLARMLGRAWDAINARHHAVILTAVEANDGRIVRTEGDAVFAVFPEAGAAVEGAVAAQLALDAESWPTGTTVWVRMGLHTGEAHLAGDDYGGFDVNRAARIAAVGHGGQIVASQTTHALVSPSPPPGVSFRDLGQHVLKDLPIQEHLWQVDVPGRRVEFPPLRVAGRSTGNLPERLTSFIGRSEDVETVAAILDGSRLVTLTGPGGIGKTSLAVEVARRRAPSTPDGAWFVGLDTIDDPALVATTIARSLGLFDGVDRAAGEALPAYLSERSVLLVIDNFEHVLDAAGEVAALVRLSPGSRFIVTSRAPLRLSGEQEFPVRPLSTSGGPEGEGGSGDPAMRLFVDRARSVTPGWEPGADQAIVAEICRLVDGLPLGIELAAARISMLPVRAIRDRLAAHLPLPGSGLRDAPVRQRTLEAMIEWSHDLLDPDDRRAFHELGVFEGTFDAEQAGVVIAEPERDPGPADIVDRLIGLAERSLIARDVATLDDDARLAASGIRFGMLRTVQTFAAGRLVADGRDGTVRDRHATAYLAVAEAAAPNLFTRRQPRWLDRLARDDANLAAALRSTIEAGDVGRAFRFLAAEWRYWLATGRLDDGARWVDAAFAMAGSDRPVPARVGALAAAGGIAYWRADRAATRRWYEEQLNLALQVGDAPGAADASFNLASSLFIDGEPDRSRHMLGEARRRFEGLDDWIGVNRVDWALVNLFERDARGLRAGVPKLLAILDLAEALDDAPYVALGAGSVAWSMFRSGNIADAGPWAIRSVVEYYGMRDVASTTVSLPTGALLALEAGQPHEAAMIMGASDALSLQYGVRAPLPLDALIQAADPLGRARLDLGPEAFDEALAMGSRMTLGEAVDLVVQVNDRLKVR